VLTIYGDSISGNCLKVKWTADYLGLKYDWVETDVLAGKTRSPEFLALNPAGQVPVVILADGKSLAQSNAIILHLSEQSHLVPLDPYARAKMFEWLFWEQYSHEPYIAVARFQLKYLKKRKEDLDAKIVEKGAAALERLEMALAASPYLVGDQLTLADISLVAYTRMAEEGGFDLQPYPALREWIGRLERILKISV
jgi:glutathione S-transferase